MHMHMHCSIIEMGSRDGVILVLAPRQWKKVPLSSKLGALSAVSRASDSLRSLKDIYDRDCEKAKAAEVPLPLHYVTHSLSGDNPQASVAAAEIKLTEAQARQMQLDKALRRVERKWTAGVATAAELERIQTLRTDISEAKLTRWPSFPFPFLSFPCDRDRVVLYLYLPVSVCADCAAWSWTRT